MSETIKPIGKVTALFRHPVKSMRGESVEEMNLGITGVEGDRRYAFIQAESKSGFPWLTARNFAALVLYTPFFQDNTNPKKSPVIVRTPEGRELAVEDPELKKELEEKSNRKLTLLHLGRGAYDALPVSVLSAQSVNSISRIYGNELDVRRFRPNIYLNQFQAIADFDGEMVGHDILVGNLVTSPRISLDMKDPRCKIPNIDPSTGVIDKKIITLLETNFSNLFGLYGTVKTPGVLRVGEDVNLLTLN
jgi:uncharacterized protein